MVAVVHLRGHTPGSVALVLPGAAPHPTVALTGDSLFPGGVGNTWEDPERFASLLDDVTARLFDALPGLAVRLTPLVLAYARRRQRRHARRLRG